MLGDRKSVYEQSGLDLDRAIKNEFQIGMNSINEAQQGALRFVQTKPAPPALVSRL